MELKEYLRNIGLAKAKILAEKIDVNYLYLYHIASGFRKPSPYVAMKIQCETENAVKVEELLSAEKSKEYKKIIGLL